jgi:hypothetical protein
MELGMNLFKILLNQTNITSSFYYHQKQFNLPDKYKEIKVLIKTIYQRHKGRYG